LAFVDVDVDTYRVIAPREANGIPMMKVTNPPIMQPQVAIEGVLAAMQRAWKSKAAKFPNARMKIVAQFQKIALGLQEEKWKVRLKKPKWRICAS
jgi:hypothetical protein